MVIGLSWSQGKKIRDFQCFFSDAILNSKVFLLVVKIFSKKIDSF